MKKETNVLLQKPKPFIAHGSQAPITEEDIKKRERKIKRLEQIGERPTRVTEEEYENPYKIQAIALIEEDKDVPEELIKKINEFGNAAWNIDDSVDSKEHWEKFSGD